MNCDFCGNDIEDRGMLMTVGTERKRWSCADCFVIALIKGRADIVHHWGYVQEEAKEEPEPTEE